MGNTAEQDTGRVRPGNDEGVGAARWAKARSGRTGTALGCFQPQPEGPGEHYRLCAKETGHSGDHVYLRPSVIEHLEIHMGVSVPLCLERDSLKRACMTSVRHSGDHWWLFPADLEEKWCPRTVKPEGAGQSWE